MRNWRLVAAALLLLMGVTANAAVTRYMSEWRGGYLCFRNASTHETVHVIADVTMFDDFTGIAVDATNDWTVAGVNSGTVATNIATGGTARFTTGAADDDDVDLATGLIYKASKACVMEARIAITSATAELAFNVGFTDATGEGADLLPFGYATATLTSTASDAALFFYDPDATLDTIHCASVINNVDGTITNTTTAPVVDTYNVFRVEIDTAGNVDFWLDGDHVARQALGITTTDALCAYVGVINRSAVATTLDVDYIRVWQSR